MVKLRNNLSTPVKIVKINTYDMGTLQPGETVEVPIDAETSEVQMNPA